MNRKSGLNALTLIVILLLGCKSDDAAPPDMVETQDEQFIHGDPVSASANVLFIGNSLTFFHDLPKLVFDLAASKDMEISTKMVAKSNYAIIDHWDEGEVQDLIKSAIYDFVVIQQGPSSQSEGNEILLNSGKQYADLCEQYSAKLAYYMVWPSLTNYQTFDGVINNYTAAAEANNAILCPVGQVWKAHFDRTNDFSYYGADGFHPSLKGSQVAAKVIFESLFEE